MNAAGFREIQQRRHGCGQHGKLVAEKNVVGKGRPIGDQRDGNMLVIHGRIQSNMIAVMVLSALV